MRTKDVYYDGIFLSLYITKIMTMNLFGKVIVAGILVFFCFMGGLVNEAPVKYFQYAAGWIVVIIFIRSVTKAKKNREIY